MPFSIILCKGMEHGRQPHVSRPEARSAIGGAQWGKQFLSRGMAPKLAGELNSMCGQPVVECRSLGLSQRGHWEPGRTDEMRGALTAELIHKSPRGRTER